jgi:hypothetical protein
VIAILISRRKAAAWKPPRQYKDEAERAVAESKARFEAETKRIENESNAMKERIDAATRIKNEEARLKALADLANAEG